MIIYIVLFLNNSHLDSNATSYPSLSRFYAILEIYSESHYFPDINESSRIIFQTQFFFLFSWFRIIQTVNWRLQHITYLSLLTLTPILLVEGLPLLVSSFTSSCLSLNILCLSKTPMRNILLSPYTCWNISSSWMKNFRFIHSSVLRFEQPNREWCK